jgi:hypothetical protein
MTPKAIAKKFDKLEDDISILQSEVSNYKRYYEHLQDSVKWANNKYQGLKARTIFSLATAFGLGGGWCVNILMHLDGDYTHVSALIITIIGGAIFAVIGGVWLAVYNSMGE